VPVNIKAPGGIHSPGEGLIQQQVHFLLARKKGEEKFESTWKLEMTRKRAGVSKAGIQWDAFKQHYDVQDGGRGGPRRKSPRRGKKKEKKTLTSRFAEKRMLKEYDKLKTLCNFGGLKKKMKPAKVQKRRTLPAKRTYLLSAVERGMGSNTLKTLASCSKLRGIEEGGGARSGSHRRLSAERHGVVETNSSTLDKKSIAQVSKVLRGREKRCQHLRKKRSQRAKAPAHISGRFHIAALSKSKGQGGKMWSGAFYPRKAYQRKTANPDVRVSRIARATESRKSFWEKEPMTRVGVEDGRIEFHRRIELGKKNY